MIGLLKNGCHITYGVREYVVDTAADVENLPKDCTMGSTAFVIASGEVYMFNGKKEWVKI